MFFSVINSKCQLRIILSRRLEAIFGAGIMAPQSPQGAHAEALIPMSLGRQPATEMVTVLLGWSTVAVTTVSVLVVVTTVNRPSGGSGPKMRPGSAERGKRVRSEMCKSGDEA